jgi:hypothetical protein
MSDLIENEPEKVQGEVMPVSMAEATEFAWQQMDNEPWLWYQRFIKYFLPQGPGRSLYKAYELMVATERPDVSKARLENPEAKKTTNITSWGIHARDWNWRERSKEFDKYTFRAANAEVDAARITLLSSANKAANALVSALANPRLQVAAAKEILDRAGLPGTTNVALGPIDKFTADEFRRAESEIDDWERKLESPNPKSE